MGYAAPSFRGSPTSWCSSPRPPQGSPPPSLLYQAGRYGDDPDGDGEHEDGYAYTGGSGGKAFTSGMVHLIAYDIRTGLLKYEYLMAVRESENTYTSYALESLFLFQVR